MANKFHLNADMKTTQRNIARKSAPPITPAQTETKRVKISAPMQAAAADAVQRFRTAQAEYNAAAQQAQQQHAKLMEVAQMHDGLFRAIVEEGGATVDDFKHGFELHDGFLIAKPAPAKPAPDSK